MNPNETLITHFYTCFQNKDYKGMQNCYAENAVFNDPVFKDLDGSQVKAMWEMLCKRGKDLQLEFKNGGANDSKGHAEWIATYTFSATGRKVTNRIQADFEFENGKIKKHTDTFSFYKWTSQALGISGIVLGHTFFLKNKVRKAAMNNLKNFIEHR